MDQAKREEQCLQSKEAHTDLNFVTCKNTEVGAKLISDNLITEHSALASQIALEEGDAADKRHSDFPTSSTGERGDIDTELVEDVAIIDSELEDEGARNVSVQNSEELEGTSDTHHRDNGSGEYTSVEVAQYNSSVFVSKSVFRKLKLSGGVRSGLVGLIQEMGCSFSVVSKRVREVHVRGPGHETVQHVCRLLRREAPWNVLAAHKKTDTAEQVSTQEATTPKQKKQPKSLPLTHFVSVRLTHPHIREAYEAFRKQAQELVLQHSQSISGESPVTFEVDASAGKDLDMTMEESNMLDQEEDMCSRVSFVENLEGNTETFPSEATPGEVAGRQDCDVLSQVLAKFSEHHLAPEQDVQVNERTCKRKHSESAGLDDAPVEISLTHNLKPPKLKLSDEWNECSKSVGLERPESVRSIRQDHNVSDELKPLELEPSDERIEELHFEFPDASLFTDEATVFQCAASTETNLNTTSSRSELHAPPPKRPKVALTVYERVFQRPEKLHISFSMLSLVSEDDRQRVMQVLKECITSLSVTSPLQFRLRGLGLFGSSASRCRVLYLRPVPASALQELADLVDVKLREAGLSASPQKQGGGVVLHATVMNVTFVQRAGRRWRGFRQFDAEPILERLADTDLGLVTVDCLEVSALTSKDADGYYSCMGKVPFCGTLQSLEATPTADAGEQQPVPQREILD